MKKPLACQRLFHVRSRIRMTCATRRALAPVSAARIGARRGGCSTRGRRGGAGSLYLACLHAEQRHHVRQLHGLLAQAGRRGGGFLHQRGVLLRHLVKLVHGGADLGNALAWGLLVFSAISDGTQS